ncbi:MAG TPA: hypothetical protein VGI07_13655 [Solirubrobacteraceae bacterium]
MFVPLAVGSCHVTAPCTRPKKGRRLSPCQYPVVSNQLRNDEIAGEKLLARFTRLDPYWGAQLVILLAILLGLSLSRQVAVLHPTWLLPVMEGVVLLALALASPHPRLRHTRLRRRLSLSVIGIVSATNAVSLVLLVRELLRQSPASGPALLGSGIVLWATNVLLFGVWFWMLDRGGPVARAGHDPDPPDFLFPQMTDRRHAPPGWKPGLIDYLYTSFTNATAFSPTDTMPLTATAKSLMAVQALTALVTIGLVVARAVNILKG